MKENWLSRPRRLKRGEKSVIIITGPSFLPTRPGVGWELPRDHPLAVLEKHQSLVQHSTLKPSHKPTTDGTFTRQPCKLQIIGYFSPILFLSCFHVKCKCKN